MIRTLTATLVEPLFWLLRQEDTEPCKGLGSLGPCSPSGGIQPPLILAGKDPVGGGPQYVLRGSVPVLESTGIRRVRSGLVLVGGAGADSLG